MENAQPHGMWTGEELKTKLSNWDFMQDGDFTATERNLMYRASTGDYNWMYDKHGNPRAGWANLWNRRGDEIHERHENSDVPIGKIIACFVGVVFLIGVFSNIIQAIAG